MKKLISLLLALLMCSAWAFAEAPDTPADPYIVETHTATQDFYLYVLIEIDQPDDTILTLPLKLKAFSIAYQYNIFRDAATEYYTGFDVDPENSLSFVPILLSEEDASTNFFAAVLNNLNLTFTHLSRPDTYSFSGFGADGYTMGFQGGEFNVRYNASFFYDSQGNLVSVTEDEVAFPYTFTTGSE